MNPIDTLYFNLGRLEGIASCLPQEQFEVGRKLDKIAADLKKLIEEQFAPKLKVAAPTAPKPETPPNNNADQKPNNIPKSEPATVTNYYPKIDLHPPAPIKRSNIDPLAAEMRAVGYRPDPTIRR